MTRTFNRYLPLLLLALLWEAATRSGLAAGLDLPPISSVFVAWFEMVKSGELISNGLNSLYRAGAGL